MGYNIAQITADQDFYRDIKREPGVEDMGSVSHGNALSAYFRDPEKNRIEFYLHTPWHVPQPCRIPVDLSLPDKELWGFIEEQARALPGFRGECSERTFVFRVAHNYGLKVKAKEREHGAIDDGIDRLRDIFWQTLAPSGNQFGGPGTGRRVPILSR